MSIAQLVVKRFYITETGTYDDLVGRPFATQMSEGHVDRLFSIMQGASKITESGVAGLAGDIVAPSATPDRVLGIANGWGTVRYKWQAICTWANSSMQENSYFIYSGYTTHTGFASVSNTFDPQMRLIVNNVISITRAMSFQGGVPVPFINVTESNQLLHLQSLGGGLDTQFDLSGMNHIQIPSTMRTRDLMRSLASGYRSEAGVQEFDMRTAVNVNKSNRVNNIPANYLARGLEAVIYGAHDQHADNPLHSDPSHAYERAASLHQESEFIMDPFLARLDKQQEYTLQGSVSWQTFMNAFPEVMGGNIIKYFSNNQAQKVDKYLSQRGMQNSWTSTGANGSQLFDSTPEALISQSLATAIPTILIGRLLARCNIHITNMIPGGNGQIVVTITDPFPLLSEIGSDYIRQIIPHAEQAIAMQVVRDLPIQHGAFFDIRMHSDIFGDSSISVSYNGGIAQPYSVPQFADAMFSPILTTNQGHLNAVAHDINWLGTATLHNGV